MLELEDNEGELVNETTEIVPMRLAELEDVADAFA